MQLKKKCNVCKRDFDIYDEQHDFRIHKKICYGSIHDGKNLNLNICTICMDKLIDNCEISPFDE